MSPIAYVALGNPSPDSISRLKDFKQVAPVGLITLESAYWECQWEEPGSEVTPGLLPLPTTHQRTCWSPLYTRAARKNSSHKPLYFSQYVAGHFTTALVCLSKDDVLST